MRVRILFMLLLVCVTVSAHSVVGEEGCFIVEHSWECNGQNCSIKLNIREEIYDYYQNDREHLAYHYRIEDAETPVNFYSFMLSDYDRPVIRALAQQMTDMAMTDFNRVNMAMTFVQSLPYAYDADSKGVDEYVRYPVETLVDGCGDCEDKVALLAALLYEMGIDFVLLSLPEHLALAVDCDGVMAERYIAFRGRRYYYVETTMDGWQIGQVPPDYAFAEVEVYPLDDAPTVLLRGMSFESMPAQVFEKADCTLSLDLHNLGPGRATGLWLKVRVRENNSQDARVLADETFILNDLPEGTQRMETVRLKSLIKENTVLEMEVFGDNIPPQTFDLRLNYSKMKLH